MSASKKALYASGWVNPMKGRVMSESSREKMSLKKQRCIKNGWRPWNTGMTMNYSEEHRSKLRANWKKLVEKITKYKSGDILDITDNGYTWMCAPDHPSANNMGYVHVHRMVAEKALGRRLKRGEVIHHIDGDKSNNRNDNLLICSTSYHFWLHAKMGMMFQMAMFRKL